MGEKRNSKKRRNILFHLFRSKPTPPPIHPAPTLRPPPGPPLTLQIDAAQRQQMLRKRGRGECSLGFRGPGHGAGGGRVKGVGESNGKVFADSECVAMEDRNASSYLQRATQESVRDVFILRKKKET